MEEAQDLRRAPREGRRTRQSQAYRNDGISFDHTDARSRRTTKHVDYSIKPLDVLYQEDQQAMIQSEGEPSQAGGRRKKKKKPRDNRLHSVRGIFGGWGHGPALLTSQLDDIALMGADPESSDDEDELPTQLKTPAAQDAAGGPANFGMINREKKAAGADADPLGVDENVKFDAVGGLDDHINALKEMVLHPLMYPEVIGKFGVQPPRGVLFHGPPGTGKTLLARALSNSIESEGKKVTFFMRKGADALSKWVGEAERQLRLLFEEAQKHQPSIIFFDEIDGLAPTRSSKTEQIHASIVATLLALMDGMDNRGQVVVIGATNRPDNVDPALRRPGRFDREFYFPLPDKTARLSIIDINTKGWEPALSPQLKDNLAELTVGYGGADLRALCTEAALNAIQGTYPQIYKSNKKLLVDPAKIKVLAKDFMISVNKIVPSSARSHTSKVEPLPKSIEPLLRSPLERIAEIIDEILPRRKKLTALEEAEYDDRDDVGGFERDMLLREIDKAKIFRPRLLVHGLRGMGQQELSSALLHKLEGLFVQSFDMATLMEDSSRSPEAAVVQLFKEVKRQKPSVIFVPDVDVWHATIGDNVLKIFLQQLRSIPANDPVLLLGMMGSETIEARPDPGMLRDLFGFSKRSEFRLERPERDARYEFWTSLITLIKKRPSEFPDPLNRKKRLLPELPEVKASPQELRSQDKQKRKQQYRDERNALNLLKMSIGVVFEQVKKKYGILRFAQIPLQQYKYLFDDAAADVVTSDLTEEQRQQLEERPFVLDRDKHGRGVLREVATGKCYYNMDIEDIEERLANGYYRRWRDFLGDIRTIMHDAMTVDAASCPDPEKQDERRRKTQELVNNVEVDLESFRREKQQLDQQLAVMYARVLDEYKDKKAKGLPITPFDDEHPIGTTTNRAPIIGQPPAQRLELMRPPPLTPLRGGVAVLTNGDSGSGAHLTNGSTIPSRVDGDVTMDDGTPAKVHTQRSALEKMAPGSQVDDYRNEGSTTTEDRSNRTSGANANAPVPNAQFPAAGQLSLSAHTPAGFPVGYQHAAAAAEGGASQGQHNSNGSESRHFPNWTSAGFLESGSQIPDTQPGTEHTNSLPRSGTSGSSTQPQPKPAAVANLLNNPLDEEEELFNAREEEVRVLHEMLAERSSGMSVEQCVQCMAELVGEVVRSAREADKRVVVGRVVEAFERCKGDIEACQVVMEGSYGV
jgi:SpoVK/Ycf46/Vps4 family AAA+-type ATPase